MFKAAVLTACFEHRLNKHIHSQVSRVRRYWLWSYLHCRSRACSDAYLQHTHHPMHLTASSNLKTASASTSVTPFVKEPGFHKRRCTVCFSEQKYPDSQTASLRLSRIFAIVLIHPSRRCLFVSNFFAAINFLVSKLWRVSVHMDAFV